MRGAVIAGMEHTLLDKQRGPARVGFLRGDSGAAACRQLDRGLIKPVAAVSRMIGRMGQVHANRRGVIRTGFVQIPFCILRRGSCHGIGGMIVNARYGGEGGAIVCVFDLPPLEVFVGHFFCGIKLGHDLVQGGVHRVLGGKLRHGVHQTAHAARHGDAVALRARVGVHAGIVHDDLHGGRVCRVAFRRFSFHQIIGAVWDDGEGGFAVGGSYRTERLPAWYRAPCAISIDGDVALAVQLKGRRLGDQLSVLVRLLHGQVVADIGHVQVDRRHAVHGRRDFIRIVSVDSLQDVLLGEVIADPIAVLASAGFHVFFDIAGQLVNQGGVAAAAGQHERICVRLLDAVPKIALRHHGPAGGGAAGDGEPLLSHLLENHGEHKVVFGFECGLDFVLAVCIYNVFLGGGGQAGHGISAGLPVIFGEQERRRVRLRLRLIEIQFQIAAGSVPVVRRVGFPQNQRGGFVWQCYIQLLNELLNGQQVIFFIQQDDAALGIGGSFGKNIAGSIAAIRLALRFAEFKCQAGQGIAVLVDFVDIAFRHVYQIVFQRHVRVDIAALQIEKVQRVVGFVREGGGTGV